MKVLPIVVSMSALAMALPALAEGDLSRADVTEIAYEMGATSPKAMFFKPGHLDLETGKAYKIVFTNTDKVKHEFDAGGLAAKVFTRKVEVLGADGEMISEVKGNIREIEVAAGGVVEWFIVPIQTGADIPVICALKGHAEAGMVGTVTIK
jgi:uncharacterized cupredoxin-like copper-binding protein